MIQLITSLLFVLGISTTFAGSSFEIKGKVTKIEKGTVTIVSSTGETQIPLKKLSKKQVKDVQKAQGNSNEILLMVPPQSLMKED